MGPGVGKSLGRATDGTGIASLDLHVQFGLDDRGYSGYSLQSARKYFENLYFLSSPSSTTFSGAQAAQEQRLLAIRDKPSMGCPRPGKKIYVLAGVRMRYIDYLREWVMSLHLSN